MSQTYQIFTDSSCDLPQERADAYELHVVPLTVQMNGKSYRNELDGREIAFSDFYAALRAGTPASTSAVNPEAFRAEMEPILQAGIDILYIGFSSGLSTTYQSGCIAAAELREKYPERTILTVDSLCASLGQGLLVHHAVQKKNSGASIEENMMSDRVGRRAFNHGPVFNMKALHRETDRLIEEFRVLCSSRNQKVGMLSGGNIQKVVVAREFSSGPVLIIADQPTRGIDVGATEFIRQELVRLARAGAAVLLVSADLNEVMELSDSLIVMHNGHIAAYFEDTADLTDDEMGEYMLGLKHQSPEEIGRVCHD